MSFASFLTVALTATSLASPDSATMSADRDGTLVQPLTVETSLGASPNLFAGRVNMTGGGMRRRLAIHFALDSIPAGSTITDASVVLVANGGQATNQTVSLHRCLADWGEGGSDADGAGGGGGVTPEPGDITWTLRFFPGTAWSSAGGDFVAIASASTSTPLNGDCVFTSAALIADVQAWVSDPSTNFGWIGVGNESVVQTTRRFGSRTAVIETERPQLLVTWTPPSPCAPADFNCDGIVNGDDLGTLLGQWGDCLGCEADLNGDGFVDGNDLGTLLGDWT